MPACHACQAGTSGGGPISGSPPQITSACPVCRQGGFQGGCFKLWRVRRAGESAGGGGGVPLRVRHAKGAVAGCYFATCGEPGAPASRLCRLLSSTLLEVLALGESGVPASQLVGASGAPRRVRHASEVVAGGVASVPWRIRYAGGPVCGRVACVFYFIFFNSFGWRAVGIPLASPRGGRNAAVYGIAPRVESHSTQSRGGWGAAVLMVS